MSTSTDPKLRNLKNTNYLNMYRRDFGRSYRISRRQMQSFILTLHLEAGLDLDKFSCAYEVYDHDPEHIALVIADIPRGSTVVSLGGQVLDIQYGQPGSMHPEQYAQLSFVSAKMARDYDAEDSNTMAYLRRHAARVIFVTGELPASIDGVEEI